ncbi:MAG: BTAD domain-containing putative transcriptional regulator [Nitrolancea sp.]
MPESPGDWRGEVAGVDVHVTDSAMRVYLLGRFEISAGSETLTADAWRSRKAAQLTKRLAITPDQALLRDQLIDVLWPDAHISSGGNSLRQVLHLARRQLRSLPLDQDRVLWSQGERIQLYPCHLIWTDVRSFADAARRAQLSSDTDAYWHAIQQYAGPLLPDDLYEDWTAFCRDFLESTYIRLLRDVARIHQERDEMPSAVTALQRLISAAPNHESAHRDLMRLFAEAGDRSQALALYEQLSVNLARAFEITPDPQTRDLYLRIKESSPHPIPLSAPESPSEARNRRSTVGNLPHPVSQFIGREKDVRNVENQVRDHRLVTLVGAGGIGKTRLAIEAAHHLGDRFPSGIWLVSLASLTDPTLLAQAIGEAISIETDAREAVLEPLVQALCNGSVLVILDNCEHIVADCAEIAGALLNLCPDLHILATSRETLRIHGERTWAVPTLAVPSANECVESALEFDSVRLFVDRMVLATPRFTLDPENVRHVCTICRRLDGMPLALELAAARASVVSLAQLADRLDDALTVLIGGPRRLTTRQQTLRATLDWSYQFLSPDERILFRRLAVFSRGWTLEMAEAVCADDCLQFNTILERHDLLASKSLIQVETGDDFARYHLLEPIRQFASQMLHEAGETDEMHRRLSLYFAETLERIEPQLSGPDQVRHFTWIEREHDNLRSALRWANEQDDPELALRIEAVMWRFWGIRWHSAEGLRWIQTSLARPHCVRTRERARATLGAGELARRILQIELCIRLFEESLEIHLELNDRRGTAWSLAYLANATLVAGHPERASLTAQESLALFRSINDRNGMARALNVMGEEARLAGDYDAAERFYREALCLDRDLGDQQGIAVRLHNLAFVALQHRKTQLAARWFRDAYVLAHELGYRTGPLSFLGGMAAIMCAAGQPAVGARLYGAWEANCALPGTEFKLHPPDQKEFERYTDLARQSIGSELFDAAWQEGMCWTLDEAVSEALIAEQSLSIRRVLAYRRDV